MKPFEDAQSYQKGRNTFSLLATLPILLVVICLIGDIFIQSTITYDAETGFSTAYTAGMLSSFSCLTLLLSSNSLNESMVSSLPAVIDVIYAIVMIFSSSKSIRGNEKFYLVTLIAYGVDFVLLIPVSIISAVGITEITLRAIDYALLFIIHAIGLGLLVYGAIVRKRLSLYEEKENIHQ